MKTIKKAYIILLPVLFVIILFLWTASMNNGNEKRYDVSQLTLSKYDDVISNDSHVIITAPKKDISIASKKFTVTIKNDSDDMVAYGYGYQMETFLDGKWYVAPYKEGGGLIPLVKIMHYAHTERDFPIYFNTYECLPGKHRIIKDFKFERPGTEEDNEIIASFEFNLY